MTERTDAIVVGLGASGAIIAEKLATAGAKVIGFDKGAHFSEEDFRFKHDELRYYSRGALVPDMSVNPITWRAADRHEASILPWASGPAGSSEPLFGLPSYGTGGGSVHWGGLSWRFRQADFRMRSAIIERFGQDALPEDTTLVDWPISYEDLEPYYDCVEWEQGVSGQAGNVNGEILEGGNPFESPRKRGYPMPPLRRGAADARFVEAGKRLGYHPFPQPAAIASVDLNGRSACVYCGFCHGFPCHVNAKTSTQVTSIPTALATGNLEIRPFTRVFQVNRDSTRRRVVGVSYFDADGRVRELEADVVVLAAYSLENTRLLLVSGINENGQVGQHFMTHNFGWFNGILPEWTNPFMGPLTAASTIDDVTSELIPDNEEGVLWGSPIISFPGDIQPIEAVHNMSPTAPRWGEGFKDWLRENYRRLFRMYSETTNFPSQRHYCDLDPKITDPFGQPALRVTHDWDERDIKSVKVLSKIKRAIAEEMGMIEWWEHSPAPFYHLGTHEVGTHRMGEDPSTSVVDPFGESHECKGLYVVGGGQFPSYGAYNPTETIQALAYFTADHLVKERT